MTETSQKIFPDEVVADVQRTWNLINSDLQAIGVDVLLRLFDQHPTYQSMFKAFKDTPRNELKNKAPFLNHALAVSKALDASVTSLNDSETLVPRLLNVGKSHGKRNVTAEQFQNVQLVIQEAISDALKENRTERVLNSWKEVLTVAISTIIKGLDQQ